MTQTSKTWGYTETGELWCDDCNGNLMVPAAPHGLLEDFDCEGPEPHRHNCETCEQ